VANRTLERGAQLAARFGATAIALSELPEVLPQFDIIVTSTASSLPILGKGLLERVVRTRKHRPVFIVDLAVPRDVEQEAGELDDVFLYSVDDLAEIVKGNLEIREAAVAEAEEIIVEQSAQFMRWLEGRAIVPTIRALHQEAEAMRSAEYDKAVRQLANGAPPEQVLETLSRALTNKFLHAPTNALNQAGEAERAELIALFQQMYKLPER